MYRCFRHRIEADLGLHYVKCLKLPFRVTLVISDFTDAGDSVDWFDSETRAAHSLYKTAKNKYNHSKTDENKSEMSRLYSIYRKLARGKERFELHEMCDL